MMDEKEINFITLGYGQDQSRPIAQNNMPDFYRKEFTFDGREEKQWSDIGAVFESHLLDETLTDWSIALSPDNPGLDPDFDNFEYLKENRPDLIWDDNYVRELAKAGNSYEFDMLAKNIDDNLSAKRHKEQNMGVMKTLVYEMFAYAVNDPLMFSPLGSQRWASQTFLKAAPKFAGVTGATVLPYEIARIQADPTSSPDELAYTIPTAAFLGGVIGPPMAKLLRGTLNSASAKSLVNDIIKGVDHTFKGDLKNQPKVLKELKHRGAKVEKDGDVQYVVPKDGEKIQVPMGNRLLRGYFTRPFFLQQSEYEQIKTLVRDISDDAEFADKLDILNVIAKMPDEIAGDMSTIMRGNVEGLATDPSVNTLSMKNWYKEMYELKDAVDLAYAKMNKLVHGNAKSISDARVKRGIEFAGLKELVGANKGYTFENLNKELVRAIRNADYDAPAPIREAANRYASVMNKFKSEMDNLEMFLNNKNIANQIERQTEILARRKEVLQNLRKKKAAKEEIDNAKVNVTNETNRLAKLQDFAESLGKKRNKVAGRDSNYYTRIWITGKLIKNKDKFIHHATRDLQDEIPDSALKRTADGKLAKGEKTASQRAEEIWQELIDQEGHFQGTGNVNPNAVNQLNRQLPFKGEWIEEFIDLDVTNVSRQYIRRMSTAIEMSRYAGDRTMTSKFHEIDDAFDDLIMSTTNADKKQVLREGREAAKENARVLRDRTLGTLISGPQLTSKNARIARALKNASTVLLAGKFVINAIADAGTIVAHHGFKRSFGLMWKTHVAKMDGLNKVLQEGKREARIHATAIDSVMHSAALRFIQNDGVVPGQGTWVENALEKGANTMFKLNMLNQWTTAAKEYSTILSVDSIIKDSVRLSKSYVANGNKILKSEQADWTRLHASGFTLEDILDLGLKRKGVNWKKVSFKDQKPLKDGDVISEDDFMYTANTDGWKDGIKAKKLKSKFGVALHNETQMAVMTPSIATRPMWLDGMWRGTSHSKAYQKRRLQMNNELARVSEKWAKAEKDGDTASAIKLQQEFEDIQAKYSSTMHTYRPLISSIFQFRTFGIAAAQKITLAMMQGRTKHTAAGIATLIPLAYLSQWAKNPDAWQYKSLSEQLLISAEYSGASNWQMDMNNTLEALAFMTELPIGIRPALGMDPKWEYQNEIEAGLSMFGTPIVPLKLVHDILFGEMSSKERALHLWRAVPFNNLLWFDMPVINNSGLSVKSQIKNAMDLYGGITGANVDAGSMYNSNNTVSVVK